MMEKAHWRESAVVFCGLSLLLHILCIMHSGNFCLEIMLSQLNCWHEDQVETLLSLSPSLSLGLYLVFSPSLSPRRKVRWWKEEEEARMKLQINGVNQRESGYQRTSATASNSS